ncbi:GNAT family N-acetyltransferase [Galactobacter sp.]|uniref:GNAT family N-acetyltransferase n=1 Tax=Galactobacter sp. TaxID=2676125 RepID=UPI0025C4E0B9|nr:GNAT family N-acetyltransferase [Galactobacter sp.]
MPLEPALPTGYSLLHAPLAELSGLTWHQISRLRQDVFVVEQDCPYPDQDSRDAEPATAHLWISSAAPGGAARVVATLRLLTEPDGVTRRIGRVATAPEHRGRGLMGYLLRAAIQLCGTAPIVLDAQAHLEGWYGSFGFVKNGEEFLEDGIPHVPMRLMDGAARAQRR